MITAITTILVAFITAVLGPIMVEWVKSKIIKKEIKESPVKEAIDMNSMVDGQLEQMMDELDCDRIGLVSFIMVVIFIQQVNQSKNFLFFTKN